MLALSSHFPAHCLYQRSWWTMQLHSWKAFPYFHVHGSFHMSPHFQPQQSSLMSNTLTVPPDILALVSFSATEMTISVMGNIWHRQIHWIQSIYYCFSIWCILWISNAYIHMKRLIYSSPRTQSSSQYNKQQKLNVKPFQIHFCILCNIRRLKKCHGKRPVHINWDTESALLFKTSIV